MNRLVLSALVAATMAPALPAQSGPSVTLFASGRTLVRQTLPLRLPGGTSRQILSLGAFDPASFAILDQGVVLGAVSYDPTVSEDALLGRFIGEEFTLWDAGGKTLITARLLALMPERWEIVGTEPASPRRGIIFGRPGQVLWGMEQVRRAPTAEATLTTDRARDGVRVMYEAAGGSWGASYRLFLGADGRFEGMATIAAGMLDLTDAEVQLLAGDIGPKAVPAPMAMQRMASAAFEDRGVASQESVGEVRLYTLPGRVSFVPGTTRTVPLFAPTPVRGELRLTVDGALPYWGGMAQHGEEEDVPVQVAYRFERRQGTPFGDLPLPAGGVSVYDTDRAGRVQLVGQGGISHTAPGEALEVSTGTAFDVTARRTQVAYSTTILPNPRRTVATIDYQVVVKNAKDAAATVEVRENRGGEWSVVTSSVAAVRRSSSRVAFPLTVPAKGEVTLTYRLRVVW